jgi:predicted transcriptional regulator
VSLCWLLESIATKDFEFTNALSEIRPLTIVDSGMPKSKLEHYETIIDALTDRYLTVDSLAFECNMNCVTLGERLRFLIENGIVKENRCSQKTLYSLTSRGDAISKTFAITRRLEKMKTTIAVIDDALRSLPVLPDPKEKKAR